MTSPILSVKDLCVSYGRIDAVTEVSLDVMPGSISTLVGANGAGKSTTLNALMGILKGRGQILFDGRPVNDLSIEARVAMGMTLVPEKRELFPTMPVEDNLRLGAFKRGGERARETLEEVYGLFPRLKERRKQLAGTLSGGERQMLAMGRALMGRPKLLMLDEPSLGLAPLIVRDIFTIIEALRQTGVAILLVEQNANAALRVADRGYVIETGRIAFDGTGQALLADPRVREAYLGL